MYIYNIIGRLSRKQVSVASKIKFYLIIITTVIMVILQSKTASTKLSPNEETSRALSDDFLESNVVDLKKINSSTLLTSNVVDVVDVNDFNTSTSRALLFDLLTSNVVDIDLQSSSVVSKV